MRDDRLHSPGGNGEGDAHGPSRRREDRRVDAEHVAVDVERRTTRIALVDGCVDLDEVVVGASSDIATARRNDAGRHGAAESERISNRQDPVSDARSLVRELGVGEVAAALDLDERQVGARIGPDHLGRVGLALIGCDLDGVGLVDDVIVGHGVAVRGDEET